MAPPETRFVRPPDDTLGALLEATLGPGALTPGEVEWVEHGSSTLVALAGDVAVRIGRQPGSTAELQRAQRLVDALPELPFRVPRSVGAAVEIEGHVAIPVERVPGSAVAPGRPEPSALIAMLEAIHAVQLEPLAEHLASPRAFCGGDRWEEVLREEVVPLLPAELRGEALRRVAALADLDAPERVLNHGDLGGSNVHWEGDRVVGVLDWDLAAADDPAEDVASVAGSFGIWDALPNSYDAGTIHRARTFQRTFPLQVVAFAVLQGRPSDEIARVVGRAERALRAEPAH